jgi:hypothetical protein
MAILGIILMEALGYCDPRLSGVRTKSLSVTADKDFYLLAQFDDVKLQLNCSSIWEPSPLHPPPFTLALVFYHKNSQYNQ